MYTICSSSTHFLFENDCSDFDVRERAAKLSSTYPTDLDGALSDKLIQFKHFVQNETSPVQLLQALERHGLKTTFPNVYVALWLYLFLPVSNCEDDRTFSVLKRVKNELRTTMSQTALSTFSPTNMTLYNSLQVQKIATVRCAEFQI
uniref:HAT C-terminal dimerisation domain-containing protein n=1 Tax=Gouania willdenowi TaxID=441366 RepID=A0A8C5E2H3_GOUWI